MIVLLLIFSFLALVFPLSKSALVYSPAIFLTASRTLLAGLVFLVYYFIADARKIALDNSFITLLISNTVFNIYLVHVLQFWALCYVPTSIGCLINNTSPFFVAILSYLLLKEPLSKARWLGLSIAFAALLPLIFAQTSINAIQCSGSITLWALGALLSAACASAYGSIILCRISRSPTIPMSYINGLSMVLGGIIMFVTSYIVESWSDLPSHMWLWFVKFVVPLSL
jgi:drug/metabolite transporter (DMT)-like permease